MIRLSLSFIFYSLISSWALANVFVGNAGSGVATNEGLYVQDLYSVNAHLHPYIGADLDPKLAKLKNFNFAVPQELLLRKLADLNRAVPNLGNYLVLVMNEYDWILVNEKLVLLREGDDPVQLPPGAREVQLANRLQGLIRVNAEGWSQLDDANKVALLIHEAMYSMLVPNPVQGVQIARDLTGHFFLSSFEGSALALRLREAPEVLGVFIPAEKLAQPTAYVGTRLGTMSLSGQLENIHFREQSFLSTQAAQFNETLSKGCKVLNEFLVRSEARSIYASFDFIKSMPIAYTYSYKVAESEYQMAVRIEIGVERFYFENKDLSSEGACLAEGQRAFAQVFAN